MSQNKYITLVLFLIIITRIPVHAQDLDSFFGMSSAYSAYALENKRVTGSGRLRQFQFQKWKFVDIEYHNNTDDFFNTIALDKYTSSSTISIKIYEQELAKFAVKAVEINFKYPTPISELGYKFLTTEDDIRSEYFLIAFLVDSIPDARGEFLPLSRMILYLDESYILRAEIVSLNEMYFVSSIYKYINLKSGKLQNANIPGIFTIEKSDQTVLAVLNNLNKRVLWKVDSLTNEDDSIVSFFTAVLSTFRFKIGDSQRLRSTNRFTDKQTDKIEEKKEQFLIDEDAIILPDQLTGPNQ